MLNPAKRHSTRAMVENSAASGLPIHFTGSSVIPRVCRMGSIGPKSLFSMP